DTAHVFTPSATGAQVGAASIQTQLNNGTDVTIETSGVDISGQQGNITVNADIKKTTGGNATLTLKADNNIIVGTGTSDGRYRTISSSSEGGKLGLKLLSGDNGTIKLGRDVNISLNGGDFYAGPVGKSGSVSLVFLNSGKIQAGNITMDVAGGLTGNSNSLVATDNLTINGPGTFSTAWSVPVNITAGDTLTLNASVGNIIFSSMDTKNGGGSIILSGKKGVHIKVDNGQIELTSAGGSQNKLNVTSDEGDINLRSNSGNVNLIKSNVSAKNNINLTADNGMVTLQGTSNTELENITSMNGNISVAGQANTESGIYLINTNMAANSSFGVINVSASGSALWNYSKFGGALGLFSSNTFTAFNTILEGTTMSDNINSSGIGIGCIGCRQKGLVNLTFNGNTSLIGHGINGMGLTFASSSNILINNGVLNVSGCLSGTGNGPGSIKNGTGGISFTNGYSAFKVNTVLKNADINMIADVSGTTKKGLNAFDSTGSSDGFDLMNGFNFSGSGNVTVTGKSNTGAGIDIRLFNNEKLTGRTIINGSSVSGNGVNINTKVNATLFNASISGMSSAGNGVFINIPDSNSINLAGNNINGISKTASGIVIKGNNVNITKGSLNGTSGGNGSGVWLTGGSKFTLDSVGIRGNSTAGSGVRVEGNLS
ncbi:hypothetical protein ADQ49_27440, partial [Salmonella enterica subsp. enterica]|nr:hypothetical protein [Salmonella enterica subsp. enterica serovar Enteritidis]